MGSWTIEALESYYAERGGRNTVSEAAPKQLKAKAVIRDTTAKMTKPERAFSEYCEARRLAGEIHTWAYEPMTFALADDTRYTPDVMVVNNDGTIECYDTKAYWKKAKKVHYTQWSLAAMKMAAEKHPYFSFAMCWQDETAEWRYRHFVPRGCGASR